MKNYKMITKFYNYYNELVETKIEETENLTQAIGAFTIYIEHPECKECILAEYYNEKFNRIIASFKL